MRTGCNIISKIILIPISKSSRYVWANELTNWSGSISGGFAESSVSFREDHAEKCGAGVPGLCFFLRKDFNKSDKQILIWLHEAAHVAANWVIATPSSVLWLSTKVRFAGTKFHYTSFQSFNCVFTFVADTTDKKDSQDKSLGLVAKVWAYFESLDYNSYHKREYHKLYLISGRNSRN